MLEFRINFIIFTMIDLPWPNRRKSLFEMEGEGSSPTTCFIQHIGMFSLNDYSELDYISQQYKRSADIIIKNGFSSHADGLFLPIGYLYRHAIELKLKSFINVFISTEIGRNLFFSYNLAII
ncbi:MAG: hypothetical protein D3923_00445 [Candidatus Electrothrix sp. AR3]|nr:hypothetical protein [Candidatus Electrothrix sp. AR3]